MLVMVSEMFITEFGKTGVCIVYCEITIKKVKTAPYLFDLLTTHHFSLASTRSEYVGSPCISADLCVLVSFTDNFCKQFERRPGLTNRGS